MNLKRMQTICDTPGVSGYEDPIQAIVTADLEKSCDKVHIDRMGNVIGRKKSTIDAASGKAFAAYRPGAATRIARHRALCLHANVPFPGSSSWKRSAAVG